MPTSAQSACVGACRSPTQESPMIAQLRVTTLESTFTDCTPTESETWNGRCMSRSFLDGRKLPTVLPERCSGGNTCDAFSPFGPSRIMLRVENIVWIATLIRATSPRPRHARFVRLLLALTICTGETCQSSTNNWGGPELLMSTCGGNRLEGRVLVSSKLSAEGWNVTIATGWHTRLTLVHFWDESSIIPIASSKTETTATDWIQLVSLGS